MEIKMVVDKFDRVDNRRQKRYAGTLAGRLYFMGLTEALVILVAEYLRRMVGCETSPKGDHLVFSKSFFCERPTEIPTEAQAINMFTDLGVMDEDFYRPVLERVEANKRSFAGDYDNAYADVDRLLQNAMKERERSALLLQDQISRLKTSSSWCTPFERLVQADVLQVEYGRLSKALEEGWETGTDPLIVLRKERGRRMQDVLCENTHYSTNSMQNAVRYEEAKAKKMVLQTVLDLVEVVEARREP